MYPHADPVTDDIEYLLNKEPILADLVNWLNEVKVEWATLARLLGVDQVEIDNIPEFKRNEDKLSSILNTWRSSMSSDYTIKHLCDVLTQMEKRKVVKKIHDDLRKPGFAEKYSKRRNYEPYPQ